ATFARKLKRDHRALFAFNSLYRKRAGQFLTALLPPKPRGRGRPGIPSVTLAISLMAKFKHQYPGERSAGIWKRIYPLAIPDYLAMTEVEQKDARQQLRERVKWRCKARRKDE